MRNALPSALAALLLACGGDDAASVDGGVTPDAPTAMDAPGETDAPVDALTGTDAPLETDAPPPVDAPSDSGPLPEDPFLDARLLGPSAVTEIVELSDGSIVVGGFLIGSAVLGAGEPRETMLTSAGSADAFVARYAADDSLTWVRSFGGTEWDSVEVVKVAPDGSLQVLAGVAGPVTIGAGEPGATTLRDATGVVLIRFELDGTLRWARRVADGAGAPGMVVAADGSITVAGNVDDGAVFGLGEGSATTFASAGGADGFVARFTGAGAFLSVFGIGTSAYEAAHALVGLSDGSVVVMGRYNQNTVFGAGQPGETTLLGPGGLGERLFIARYDPDGTLRWARRAAGSRESRAGVLDAVADTDDSVIVACRIQRAITFGETEPAETILTGATHGTLCLARYSASGDLVFARVIADGTSTPTTHSVVVLRDGSLALSGNFLESVVFADGEPAETAFVSLGSYDIWVGRYESDGALRTVVEAGGPDADGAYQAIELADGTWLVGGRVGIGVVFGRGSARELTLEGEASFGAAFLARYEL